ncbi:MAG: nicotinate-nucleotide adenylyltransferase [Acidimicrobiia bacterium]
MTGIGVFGGTFDPLHVGHLVAAADARVALGLDTVLLVVAADPWQKAGEVVAPAADRLAMVEAAVAGVDGLEADRSEIDRPGPSYTADTLAELAAREPGRELVLIVGSDVAARLDTWKRVDEVRALAQLAVLVRPGAERAVPPAGWRHRAVETPRLDISSRDIRARLAAGRPVDWLVPAPVVSYIRARGLYRSGDVPAGRPAPP